MSNNKILTWIKPYPELVLDEDKVFCRACGKIVSIEKKTMFLFSYSKKGFKSINFHYY